jgi:hypothetical protein
MLEGEGDAFWFKPQNHTKATHKTKNCQLTKANLNESTQEGDGNIFSMVIAQILVPYRQLA